MNANTNPFDLNNEQAYQGWRAHKLEHYPSKLEDLVVEVADPKSLTELEFCELSKLCCKANMAIYSSQTGEKSDREIPHIIGQYFGLEHLDHNWLGDEDGLTSLEVADKGTETRYIPYSDKPIHWHTDGYYNTPDRQINGLLLHCVRSAVEGGENALLDHEIAYILLRDENPAYIQALMHPDALTIPARYDGDKVVRAAETGPVFSINADTATLHMRYTIRKRHIEWKDDDITHLAVSYLNDLLNSDSPYIFKARLEPGMGLICNNILHDRSRFSDTKEHRRLLYRARYFDRITCLHVDYNRCP